MESFVTKVESFVTKVESFVTKVGGDGGGWSGVLLRQERCAARWGAVCCRWRCSGNWGGGGERAKKRAKNSASRMAKGRRTVRREWRKGEEKGERAKMDALRTGAAWRGWWVWKAVFYVLQHIFGFFQGFCLRCRFFALPLQRYHDKHCGNPHRRHLGHDVHCELQRMDLFYLYKESAPCPRPRATNL